MMGNVLIRDVEDHVIDAWKERARQNGGSLQQELKKLVTEHAPLTPKERLLAIRAFREKHGVFQVSRPPEDLIREDRDR
jgi:plasmid stability protein